MENVLSVAACIFKRYRETYGQPIDEMKLHKMLYFAQRESLIQNDQPLFDATFYGWKYGPVLKELRIAYKEGSLLSFFNEDTLQRIESIVNRVFMDYAEKNSWSLSRLSHGELSWIKSREGIEANTNSDVPMKLEDIRKDAQRIRKRRELLSEYGLL